MTDSPRLPFVNIVGDGKSGGRWAYFRSKETGHIRLPGTIDSPDFHRAYADALALRDRLRRHGSSEADADSLAWLIDRFQHSAEYAALADPTQADYAKTATILADQLGDQPFRYITRAMIKAVRDDFAATPRKANKVQQLASRLYGWADEQQLVPAAFNPAKGLKKLKRKGGTQNYVPWSDPEIDWAIAAARPHELTPLLLFIYTGQRCADVCEISWIRWQGDLIRVRTSKTHQLIDLPCHPVLKVHLEQLRASAKVISLNGPICLNKDGQPYTPGALGGVIRRLVERVPRIPDNRSPHGLRYAAAARMDEGGATPVMIAEVLGQRTYRVAMQYASGRLRAAQGIAAMKGPAPGL
jgi:integrase